MMSKVILDDGVDAEMFETFMVFNSLQGDEIKGINAEELQKTLSKFGCEVTLEEAQDVIQEADWDGDGYLNF